MHYYTCRCRNILLNLKKKKAEYDELMEKLQREVINSLKLAQITSCTMHVVQGETHFQVRLICGSYYYHIFDDKDLNCLAK